MKTIIKTIDWNEYVDRGSILNELRDAFHNVGCLIIKHAPIDVSSLEAEHCFVNAMLPISGNSESLVCLNSDTTQYETLYIKLAQLIAMSLNLQRLHFRNSFEGYVLKYRHSCLPVTHAQFLSIHIPQKGFCIRYKEDWLPVELAPDSILVCVGALLEHLTAGFYRAVTYRVGEGIFQDEFIGYLKSETNIEPVTAYQWLDPRKENFPYRKVGTFKK